MVPNNCTTIRSYLIIFSDLSFLLDCPLSNLYSLSLFMLHLDGSTSARSGMKRLPNCGNKTIHRLQDLKSSLMTQMPMWLWTENIRDSTLIIHLVFTCYILSRILDLRIFFSIFCVFRALFLQLNDKLFRFTHEL